MIILDTNVLSELMQKVPDPSVIEWLDQLATRNVKHFADLTAEVVDPWEAKR